MNNIQIFELTLKDYRQYEGESAIDLETNTEQNINVIVGQNGAGKSNILNAITLCFYGEEAHIDSRGGEGLNSDPYITKRKLAQLEPGESMQGYVEVKLGKEEPEYAFRRSFTTARQPQDNADEPVYTNSLGDLVLRQRFGGNDWAPIPDPENVLREILPTHVHQYFLFDGEQLDEFFEEGYAARVKEAVLDVSHIELLNNAIEHLQTVRRDYEKESSNLGGDVSRLQSRKEQAEQERNRLRDERDDLESELETAQRKVANINEKLSASGDESVRELQNRREFLEGKLEEKDEQLTTAMAEVGTSLSQAGAVGYNADALSKAITILEEQEASDDSLPGLTEELLEAILSRGECICGADLFGSDTHAHIEELLNDAGQNGHKGIDGRLRIKRALNNGETLVEELIGDQQEVERIRDWIDEKETELTNISANLEDKDTIDSEKAAELEEQRRRISDRVSDINRQIGQLETQIEKQEQTIETRRNEWQQAMDEREESALLVEKSVFVGDAIEKLQAIKRDILHQVRTQTEQRLEQYYNDLIWKEENYDIDLTEDYQVELYDQDGRKNLGSLAAGERQVLALSFMAALSKISGFSAPIVIDTPLGRISSDPKRRIAQNVPSYLEDTQVTFLMTDVEFSEDVRAFIVNEVANEYHLDYQAGVTDVVKS